MAASKRIVAAIDAIAITPSQMLKAPMSAGVHSRVSNGAASSGRACAPVAPTMTVATLFQ